ncbi:glycosyltransferase family 2 protein [Ideonella sp. YS5]|uniref:glycosyltransferase family 2 protein n=1 Tax=Ideonella sp. YS5 TaxID=3453714 RepID=UPI003EF0404F
MIRTDRTAERRIERSRQQLRPRTVRAEAIASAWSLLVCCARNEMPRMPAFLDHYRRLGVGHFLVVDNQSEDGLQDYLGQQPDCSSWLADGSYKASNFGMDWCNVLLAQYGVGKWCVTVDPDELLVYPHCEERDLHSLTVRLEAIGQPSLFTVLLDAYGEGPLSQTTLTPGADPFAVCPWFDRFNLTQRFDAGTQSFWVQGGVRMRRFFADNPEQAPALNKVPLVRWANGLRYVSSMHHLNDTSLNCTVNGRADAVSGVLFHFKYVSLLREKASEEMVRGEHYAGSTEYKAYFEAGDVRLYDPEISLRYAGSGQLQRLGFMQAGTWF